MLMRDGYQGFMADLNAMLMESETPPSWQEYSVKLHAAMEECNLAYAKFREHFSSTATKAALATPYRA